MRKPVDPQNISPPAAATPISNSTLQPWLDAGTHFSRTGKLSLPQLHPCINAQGSVVNCSSLCTPPVESDAFGAIFDPMKPNNLINCGLWRTACSSIATTEESSMWLQQGNVEVFRSVGFEFGNAKQVFQDEYQAGLEFDWGACFGELWGLVNPNQPAYQGFGGSMSVPTVCDMDRIFHGSKWALNFPVCVNELCHSKGWLNPDIGGIGVYASFILQTAIAVLFLALIVTTEHLPTFGQLGCKMSSARGSFKERLLAANSEFFKAQCYFTGSIQIASIVLASQKQGTSFVEYGLFFALATSGYGPVILNLLCISRYGRSSWYFIILATCCFLLSTTTLGFSQWFWTMERDAALPLASEDLVRSSTRNPLSDNFWNLQSVAVACGGNSATTLLQKWCNTSTPIATGTQLSVILSPWNWVLWSICLLWLCHCYWAKWINSSTSSPLASSFKGRVSRYVRFSRPWLFFSTPKHLEYIWWISFVLSWPLVLGYQLYLYSLFFTSSQINTEWSFGQIVAITIWAPFLADFVLVFKDGIPQTYHFRLPRGFEVVKEKELPPLPSESRKP